jgi:hypothetical protein
MLLLGVRRSMLLTRYSSLITFRLTMNQQQGSTLQETTTAMPAAEVLAEAKRFFARRNSIYAAFVEKEGATFVALRGQGGEEVIIGVAPAEGGTRVTGSTYLFDQQVGRFFSTLPPARPAAPAGPPSEAGAALGGVPAGAPAVGPATGTTP